MPVELADYGVAIFAIGMFAFVVWQLINIRNRHSLSPTGDLSALLMHTNEVLQRNTEVMSRLTVLMEQQGKMFDKISERLDELWREAVRPRA